MTEAPRQPAAPPPPPPAPPPAARIRWGLGDFWWVFLAQVIGLILAGVIWAIPGLDAMSEDEAGAYLFFPMQYAAMLAALVWVARKGRGSLGEDFGLLVKLRDWTAVLVGMGLVILVGNLVRPFDSLVPTEEPAQEILQTIEESESTGILVGLGIGTIVVAPLVEEIVFRGLLLRALLRRVRPWTAVSLNGIVFGVSHLAGASGWAAVPTVLALTGFGMFLAAQALRHGSLSRPILTHVGFNLVGFLATLWL